MINGLLMSVTVKSVEVHWFKMQLFENKLAELEDICCIKRIFVTFIIYTGGTVRAKKLEISLNSYEKLPSSNFFNNHV